MPAVDDCHWTILTVANHSQVITLALFFPLHFLRIKYLMPPSLGEKCEDRFNRKQIWQFVLCAAKFTCTHFVHDRSSNNVNQLFQPISVHHDVATRSSTDSKLSIPVTRLKTCEQNVKIRGAKYYNELPGDIRNAPSEASFKSRAKKYLYHETN